MPIKSGVREPTILVLATASARGWVLGVLAGVVAAATWVMWHLFASSGSSTSGLIFAWRWFAGIPVAGVLVVLLERLGRDPNRSR